MRLSELPLFITNMKNLIKVFVVVMVVFLASSAFAGVTHIIVDRVPAFDGYPATLDRKEIPAVPQHYKVTAWGLLDNGRPKVFLLNSDSQIKKCKDFENCALFDHNREAIRCVIIFDGEEVRVVDFHMEETFETKQWTGDQLDSQCNITLKSLKDYLEAK